jgi:PEP-CTERM motif-containing protein
LHDENVFIKQSEKLGIAAKKYQICDLSLTFREPRLKENLSGGYFYFSLAWVCNLVSRFFFSCVLRRRSPMKLRLYACLAVVGALVAVTPAVAAPDFTPFLSVDINGYNAGGGQSIGPTEAGFQDWEMAEGLFLDPAIDWGNSGAGGLTKVFPTSEGNITANLIGVVPNSFRGARNRGANTDAGGSLTQDFVFAQRDNAIAFGRNYVRLNLTGLVPNSPYEITTWARDHFNGGADSFEAWSTREFIGVDGPSAWMDANVGAGSSYQPAAGGANNPIPTLARSPVSGPAGADLYSYAATFRGKSDGSGALTVYGWADPNSFSGVQGASLLNAFQVGVAPEPTSLVMFALGLLGVALANRRR